MNRQEAAGDRQQTADSKGNSPLHSCKGAAESILELTKNIAYCFITPPLRTSTAKKKKILVSERLPCTPHLCKRLVSPYLSLRNVYAFDLSSASDRLSLLTSSRLTPLLC
jgi:hypothetical protein